MLPIPIFYKSLTVSSVSTILTPSNDNSSWDSWGVRDIAILSDRDGFHYKDGDSMVFYYTGSTSRGKIQQTGRAISRDTGKTWQRNPLNPILRTSPGEWDANVASTPWVIKNGDNYYMYYRGSINACSDDAVGLAISKDGINFSKYSNNPILQAKDFAGIRQRPITLGVMNAVFDYEGSIILLFEANESCYDQCGQIFAAYSNDCINFKVMNNGNPIFSARNVSSWPVKRVCNPRLTKVGSGWFMLGFNGSQNGEYSIGVAFTNDFIHWHEHPSNPILIPRGWPSSKPYTYRLEGPCFDTDSIISDKQYIDCYFMTIPLGAINHQNATNAKAVLSALPYDSDLLKVHAFPENKEALLVTKESISVDSSLEPSQFLQCHLIRDSLAGINFKVSLDSLAGRDSSVYIVISNSLTALQTGNDLILKITRNHIHYFSENSFNSNFPYFFSRFLNLLRRKSVSLLSKCNVLSSAPHAPLHGWQQLLSHPLDSEVYIRSESSPLGSHLLLKVYIDNEEIVELTACDSNSKILTFACFKSKATFTSLSNTYV